MKLIQIKDYLLLVEKVNGFKVGGWNYEKDNTIPVYQFEYNIDEYPGNKIIAYYPLTKEVKELDLPLLPNPFENFAYINELAIKHWECRVYEDMDLCCDNFIAGYKAAQSNTKQFSLEDIKKAFNAGEEYTATEFLSERSPNLEQYIQSLSTQQLPVSFEPEYEITYKEYKNGKKELISVEFHKITSSEGKEFLVGTYKY